MKEEWETYNEALRGKMEAYVKKLQEEGFYSV